MSASKRRPRTGVWVLVALSVAVAALVGSVAGYGYYVLDWGCPSTEESERPKAMEEVVDAFGEHALDVEPVELPVVLAPGAQAYRYQAENANLFVVVCKDLCQEEGPEHFPDLSRVEFGAGEGPVQRMRHGIGFLNVQIWATDEDRRSAGQLINRVHPVVDDLDPSPSPDDRCYVR